MAEEEQNSAEYIKSAIYSLIEHHDKRTLTVGCACASRCKIEFVSLFLHIDIVDACTCSLQRLSHIYSRSEKFYVHTCAVFISQRSIERTGEGSRAVGFDQFEQTETKRKTKGEREREGYCGLKIFQQHGSFGLS